MFRRRPHLPFSTDPLKASGQARAAFCVRAEGSVHTQRMVIAVEGLPGAGKTTAAGLVADRIGATALRETTADHPFLQQVYDDAHRDDLTLELSFLLVHANPYRLLDRTRTTICDFSPAKDLLFAEDMLGGRDLTLFDEIYAHVYEQHPLPEVVVYLNAEPSLCLARVRHRMTTDPSRSFEAGMTLERLERMRSRYEDGLEQLGESAVVFNVEASTGPEALADAIVGLLQDRVPAQQRS